MDNTERIRILYEEELTIKEIAQKIPCSTRNVVYHLRKLYGKDGYRKWNGSKRKYTLDEKFFKELDREDKMYFLGLLAADGCIHKSYIRLFLQEDDKSIIELFQKCVKTNKPLELLSGRMKTFSNGKDYQTKNQVGLVISSVLMTEHLLKYGLKERKSLTLKIPQIVLKNKLAHHFIRGYFDGDGSIYVRENLKNIAASFASSKHFCEQLYRFFTSKGIKCRLKRHSKNPNTHYCMILGNSNTLKLYKYMYKDATIFFERKRKKFDLIPTAHRGIGNLNQIGKDGRKRKNQSS